MKQKTHIALLGILWIALLISGSGCNEAADLTATAALAALPATAQPETTQPATLTPSPMPATDTPQPPTATATATAVPTLTPSATATATATPTIGEQIAAATIRIVVEGSPYLEAYVAAGSGVIFDAAGLALTNYHLVEGAGILQVSLADGSSVPAQILGRSACDDVAVLQLAGSDFPSLAIAPDLLGDSIAAGFPLGATAPEITNVSILNQPLTQTLGFVDAISGTLQLADSLDSGFSGGALVSEAGLLNGILSIGNVTELPTAYVTSAGELEALVQQLVLGEHLNWLGMNVGPIPAESVQDENAPVTAAAGLLVYAVDLRGPAQAIGVRAGDILVSLAGEDLTDEAGMQTFCEIVRGQPLDEPLAVIVERQSERYLGEVNGSSLEKEVVVISPTATPAPIVATVPVVATLPAATEPPVAAGGFLDAILAVRNDMRSLGGFLDGLLAAGCLNNNVSGLPIGVAGVPAHVSCIHKPADCQRIVATHARIVNARRFGAGELSGAEVGTNNIYESAIATFSTGTSDIVAACHSLIENPDNTVSNLIVAVARQSIAQAVDALNPAIENLQPDG